MAKHTERFDPKGVGPLVDKAKDGDLAARDQLLYQFQRLVISLVDVCVTAKYNPNPRGKHVQFLKLFSSPTTPMQNTAHVIKNQLTMYTLEEVRHAGNVAAVQAIYKSKQNYSSTLVICFAELIKDMIKDGKITHMDESHMSSLVDTLDEDSLMFRVFMHELSEEEWIWARAVLDGNTPKTPPPPTLVEKMRDYTDPLLPRE